jgi:hypothetical protein
VINEFANISQKYLRNLRVHHGSNQTGSLALFPGSLALLLLCKSLTAHNILWFAIYLSLQSIAQAINQAAKNGSKNYPANMQIACRKHFAAPILRNY